MSYLAHKFYIVLEDFNNFEYDLDYILAASTLVDPLPVYLTPIYQELILKHKIYSKQFSGLHEFGVEIILVDELPPSPVIHVNNNPNLINYDELVDLVVKFNGGKHDANTR